MQWVSDHVPAGGHLPCTCQAGTVCPASPGEGCSVCFMSLHCLTPLPPPLHAWEGLKFDLAAVCLSAPQRALHAWATQRQPGAQGSPLSQMLSLPGLGLILTHLSPWPLSPSRHSANTPSYDPQRKRSRTLSGREGLCRCPHR